MKELKLTKTETIAEPFWRDRLAQFFGATALFFAIAFAITHLAGWRPYASMLSGSLPETTTSPDVAILLGLLYTISYFGLVLLSPICLIALTIYLAITRGVSWRRK